MTSSGATPLGSISLADADGDALKIVACADGRMMAKTVHGGMPDATRVFLSLDQQRELRDFLISNLDAAARTFSTYCPNCHTGDIGIDDGWCAACGERIEEGDDA